MSDLLNILGERKDFSAENIAAFIEGVEHGKIHPVQQAAILSALNVKGITSKEVAGFVQVLSQKIPEVLSLPNAIDLCGTGGSGLPRINTSTLAAFIVSGMGVPVAKHGNNAASGRFGSFDLLEKLEIAHDVPTNKLQKIYEQLGLCFLYAKKFHPVFKHFASVRKDLGIKTIFNLLGPLLNPAGAQRQIIGTSSKEQMMLMAEAAKILKRKHIMVVCGHDGLDEVTLTGKTFVAELKQGQIRTYSLSPKSFGVSAAAFADIKGGDGNFNEKVAREILQGTCQTRHLDLVLINCALALKLAGKYSNLKKAYQEAKKYVNSGQAYSHFMAYKNATTTPGILLDIVLHKKQEVEKRKKNLPLKKLIRKLRPSDRDFTSALLQKGISLIAEIKKASPKEGLIVKGPFSVDRIARIYEQSGARAISVLTDEKYFQGSLQNLRKAREATKDIPLLCKDFIVDEYQIYEARSFGADAILLIAGILTKDQVQIYLRVADELKMAAICEVHNEEELKMVLETGAEIIGINNRDLNSFKVSLNTTSKLAKKIPANKIIISESGISTRAHLKKLPKQTDAILVGTSILRSPDITKKIQGLIGKPKPMIKLCGIRSLEQAQLCAKLGVDFIGLNFVPTSPRRISYQLGSQIIQKIREQKTGTKVVGVFQNQDLNEINTAAEKIGLDFIQLSGDEPITFVKKCKRPVIKGVSIIRKGSLNKAARYVPYVKYLLLDSAQPGSGKGFDHKILKKFPHKFFLAGGIRLENVRDILKLVQPFGVDTASGIETDGEVDLKKIQKFIKLI
ncbi:MAG: bifunctional indole-3-glycerol-phosphate synthase TrpC/phosphoribosylanthranilate isomerase TrpF [Candidatus Altimarinota bacterium]